jgi:enoyl-CoA hydratase/carnithine racemase
MSELLNFHVDAGVATITLKRPDKLNAFTAEMLEDWLAALDTSRPQGGLAAFRERRMPLFSGR